MVLMEECKSEEKKKRGRKTTSEITPGQLAIKANLNELCLRERDAKKKMAKACGISPSSVTKWTSMDQSGIPSAEYLVKIAEYFRVSVDWLIKAHPTCDSLIQKKTHADTFLTLIPIVENGALNIEGIEDPILCFLVKEGCRVLMHPNITLEKKNKWLNKVTSLYDLPMPRKVEPDLWEKIRDGESSVSDSDLLIENASLAKLVGNEVFMSQAYGKYLGT